MTMSAENSNPEIDQDRAFDLLDHFEKFGYVMFSEQQRIYQHLAEELEGRIILEAGCGNGVGSAMLDRTAHTFLATDKLLKNVKFAKQLYPWIDFRVWDINGPLTVDFTAEVVVCVEMFEHVANPEKAIRNLIEMATREVWISTPNGRGKPRPPKDPFHVYEYTTGEILELVGDLQVTIRDGVNWRIDYLDTRADPLVYQIEV